jgi:hypothetical protein
MINKNCNVTERVQLSLRFLCLIAQLFFSSSLYGQWQKLFGLRSIGEYPSVITFIDSSGIPIQGYVGIGNLNTLSHIYGRIQYTLDGGISWKESLLQGDLSLIPDIKDIAIINADLAWATCGPSDDEGPLFKTTNGGGEWEPLSPGKGGSSFYFHKDLNWLFWGSWGKSLAFEPSTGTVLTTFPPIGSRNGLAFLSPAVGVWSTMAGGCVRNQVPYYTNDSGKTWSPSITRFESWQPLAILDSNLFLTVDDQDAVVWRSQDSGKSWQNIYDFTNGCESDEKDKLTGCIRRMGCNLLVVQTGDTGIFISKNGGYLWKWIAGPANYADTRFYTNDNYIVAGGHSNKSDLKYVWKLDIRTLPPEILPLSISAGCQGLDTVVRVERYMACEDTSGVLLSATIEGSPAFSFSNIPAYPHVLSFVDSIGIRFKPMGIFGDTSYLRLRFNMNGAMYDTLIQLTGRYSDLTRASSEVYLSTNDGGNTRVTDVGELVPVYIKTRQQIPSGSTIQTILVKLDFNPSVLTVVSTQTDPSWVIENQTVLEGYLELQLRRIASGDINSDSNIAIVNFSTTIGDQLSSLITLEELAVNSTTSALGCSNVSILLNDECGNSLISSFLRTRKLNIHSIFPNPTQHSINIGTETVGDCQLSLQILDLLGNIVQSEFYSVCGVRTQLNVQTKDLQKGHYILRLSAQGSICSARFVKQ